MSVDRLIELLGHSDADWRRQGRELMKALGSDASVEVLRRCTRDGWLWPLGDGDASDLVVALAESDEIHLDRQRVRELPPIAVSDERDVMRIARGFPNATLRLIWERPPESVAFLAELPTNKLQLSVGSWTAEPPRFSEALRRLVFFGAVPELDAPALRELEVASWSSGWFETTFDRLAPQLERLHVLNRSGELPARFPRLRDLRAPELPHRLRTDAPLERVHVGLTVGRSLLDHSAMGPHTRIRADDWPQPDPTLVGDPRVTWVDARRQGWNGILESLPNLEVAHVDDADALPVNVLPTPRMLTHDRMSSARRKSSMEEWARRGRPWALRSQAHTVRKIPPIKRIRTFSAWGLADAKRFFEAIDENRLVALSTHEALYWKVVLRDMGMGLEVIASCPGDDR